MTTGRSSSSRRPSSRLDTPPTLARRRCGARSARSVRSQERPTSNVSPHTTACTGPSNSALASLITSSRDVHGGMWVSNNSPTPAARGDPAGFGAGQMQVGRAIRRVRPGRLAQEDVGAAGQIDHRIAVAGVAAVDERGARRVGDPHAVGLGRVAHQPRRDVDGADRDGLAVHPVPDVEDVGAVVDLAAVRRRRRAEPRPGVARARTAALSLRRRRVIAAPDEQARAHPGSDRRADATAARAPNQDLRGAAARRARLHRSR